MSPSPTAAFAASFLEQIATGATGALDVRDGKRRWLFYFEDGALVGTRSNLKSESLDTIRGQKPDLSDRKVALLQAIRRIKNATSTGQPPRFVDAAEPKERVETDAALVLVKGLVSALGEDELEALATDALARVTTVAGDWTEAGASSRLAAHLGGSGESPRSGDDRVAGAPGRRAEALAVLWVADGVGVLADADDAADDDDAPGGALGGLDFSNLISDAIDDDDDGDDDSDDDDDDDDRSNAPSQAGAAAPSRFAPFGGGSAAALTIDTDDDDDNDTAPPKRVPGAGDPGGHPSPLGIDTSAPSPEQAIHVEAVSIDTPVETTTKGFTFPSFQAAPAAAPPPAAPKHPKEDQLRALHTRLEMCETHFDVLEVKWDADLESFRQAHLHLARQLHPDRYADAPDEMQDLAHEAFDKVRAAWEVLGDEESRHAYIDKVIHGKKTEEEMAMEQVEAYWAAEAEFKKGLALFNAGRASNAHDYFANAVDKVPDELEFRAYWAFTSFQRAKVEDPEKAEEFKEILKDVLDKNQQQDRKLDAGWVLMGRIYKDLGNDTAAKRCFVQALKLNPANGDANREYRRLAGGGSGGAKSDSKKKDDKKGGFFGRLFGGKK